MMAYLPFYELTNSLNKTDDGVHDKAHSYHSAPQESHDPL